MILLSGLLYEVMQDFYHQPLLNSEPRPAAQDSILQICPRLQEAWLEVRWGLLQMGHLEKPFGSPSARVPHLDLQSIQDNLFLKKGQHFGNFGGQVRLGAIEMEHSLEDYT